MKWLWFVGPLLILATYLAVVLTSTREDARRKVELNRWIDELLGPLLVGKKQLSRRVRALPRELEWASRTAGGGARVADIVLVPQLAYLAVRATDAETLSGHHSVVCKLKKPAPRFVCRPLPIVDGHPSANGGVRIDDDFGKSFIVEGDDGKGIRKWLDADVRAAIAELPEVWVHTDGATMAVSLYGAVDADQLDALVAVADGLFAAYGASNDSLFGEPDKTRAAARERSDAPGEIAPQEDRILAGAIDFGLYGLAVFLLALVNGSFESIHPMVLFNNADTVVSQPWQGGFTTKGMGAFTAALGFLVGLFAYQSYLAAHHGRSIGKWYVGLRIVRTGGGPVGFVHGVLLRSWLFGAVVLAVAAALTRPFASGAFFLRVATFTPLAVGAGLVALCVATLTRDRDEHRGLHDRLADTKVVEAERLRVPSIQLAAGRGMDPVVAAQVRHVAAVAAIFTIVHYIGVQSGLAQRMWKIPEDAFGLVAMVPILAGLLFVRLTSAPR